MTAEGESRIECPESDSYYGSEYYQKVGNVPSWQDCGRICLLTTNCEYWSFDKEAQEQGQECSLYDQRLGLEIDFSYVSGEKGCPNKLGCDGSGGNSGSSSTYTRFGASVAIFPALIKLLTC